MEPAPGGVSQGGRGGSALQSSSSGADLFAAGTSCSAPFQAWYSFREMTLFRWTSTAWLDPSVRSLLSGLASLFPSSTFQ